MLNQRRKNAKCIGKRFGAFELNNNNSKLHEVFLLLIPAILFSAVLWKSRKISLPSSAIPHISNIIAVIVFTMSFYTGQKSVSYINVGKSIPTNKHRKIFFRHRIFSERRWRNKTIYKRKFLIFLSTRI